MKPVLLAVAVCTLTSAALIPAKGQQHPPAKVTFSNTIKPIIDKKCVSCHFKGGAAPFPLQTYAQVKKRDDLCKRMMLTRSMPPCYATSDLGEFCSGGGPLTDDECIQLQEWVDSGSPEGDATESAPNPDPMAWQLGKPDTILKPQYRYEIPEEGDPYWRAIVIPLGSLQGKRIRAFDVHVDQPLAIRSVVMAVARDGLNGTRRALDGFQTGGSLDFDAKKYLGNWAPGYPAWELPKGVSMTLNGSSLILQIFCIPRGKEESGDLQVGLYFAKGDHDAEPQWLEIGQEEFSIPAPGSLVLNPKGSLPKNSRLLAVMPEARSFCTSIRMWSDKQVLFQTRIWEPYWRGVYRYQTPVDFPNGAELTTEFSYDNDIHMGHNEGRRPRPILPGYRERDELCRMHVLYVVGKKSSRNREIKRSSDQVIKSSSKPVGVERSSQVIE